MATFGGDPETTRGAVASSFALNNVQITPRYNRGMAGELQSVAPESTPESGNRLTRFLALNRTVGIVLITVLLFGLGEELWRPFLPVQFNAQTKEIAGAAAAARVLSAEALWYVGFFAF